MKWDKEQGKRRPGDSSEWSQIAQKAIHSHNTGQGTNHLSWTMPKKCSVKRIFLTAQVRKELFSLNITLEEFFAASTKATAFSCEAAWRSCRLYL